MLVKCHKIINPVTQEELEDESSWLEKGKIYTVLALVYSSKSGMDVYIQTDRHHEPQFTSLTGFEIVSENIPTTWVNIIKELEDEQLITMMPESWNYNSFFEDVDHKIPEAVALFHREAELIYQEDRSKT